MCSIACSYPVSRSHSSAPSSFIPLHHVCVTMAEGSSARAPGCPSPSPGGANITAPAPSRGQASAWKVRIVTVNCNDSSERVIAEQYLWSREEASRFEAALRAMPDSGDFRFTTCEIPVYLSADVAMADADGERASALMSTYSSNEAALLRKHLGALAPGKQESPGAVSESTTCDPGPTLNLQHLWAVTCEDRDHMADVKKHFRRETYARHFERMLREGRAHRERSTCVERFRFTLDKIEAFCTSEAVMTKLNQKRVARLLGHLSTEDAQFLRAYLGSGKET